MQKYISLIFLIMILVSCDEPRGNFDQDTFNHKRHLWLEQNIKNYSFRIVESYHSDSRSAIMYIKNGFLYYVWLETAGGYGVFLPEARPGNLTGLLPSGEYYVPEFYVASITELYKHIEHIVNKGGWRYKIHIEYDNEWYYPKYYQSEWGVGKFQSITISEFFIDPEFPEEPETP